MVAVKEVGDVLQPRRELSAVGERRVVVVDNLRAPLISGRATRELKHTYILVRSPV